MKEKQAKSFPIIYPNAAGIDIASKEYYVAVNPGLVENAVRCFGCFTEDLTSIADWLKECGVNTVAMEATGIYWISLFLVLEDAGFEVVLVNAKHVKNVRGKKTDVSDAEWIRQLHSCGLLSASFQPDSFTRKLRTYMRHRKNLIEMAATHIRMMHKALEQMNIKLQHIIADIMGKSGQDIIRAILNGERDAIRLAACCDGRIRADKKDLIIKSLQGVWKEEHVFELKQSFMLFQNYHEQIKECDMQIQKHLIERSGPVKNDEACDKVKSKSNKNNLNFKADSVVNQITGTGLTELFGITATNAVEIISEVGLDMSKWPTVKHFTSWLRLAMFYHRIKAKKGAAKAIVATARKIAVIFYKMIKDKLPFNPLPIEKYADEFKTQQLKRLKRQAQKFGYQIVSA